MADTTNFSLRLDNDLKKQSEVLFSELGMNLTTAMNYREAEPSRYPTKAAPLVWGS